LGSADPNGCIAALPLFLEIAHHSPLLNDSTVDFIDRVLKRSGMSDETYIPPVLSYIEPYCKLDDARAESELVVFSMIDDLLAKTCINLDAIDILITNCSLFCPVPCITDSILNRYKLRHDIRVINLSGMGCSAAVTAVGLARNPTGLQENTGQTSGPSRARLGPRSLRSQNYNSARSRVLSGLSQTRGEPKKLGAS
jgi:3-ketoacyl-CoA synthase